jgi:hypothetical protein
MDVTMSNESASPASAADDSAATGSTSVNDMHRRILLGEFDPANDLENQSLSKRIYESLGNSKKVLVTLCLGLKATGTNGQVSGPLIDLETSPWLVENKQGTKPSNSDLAVEVQRRQKVLKPPEKGMGNSVNKLFLMKPKNKKREALLEWLDSFPICDENCVSFLTSEAERVADILQRATDEDKETAIALKHGAWSGRIPFLRLIHCITECDLTRHAFLHRNDVMERAELDAQNSPERPRTGYEVIADKWNNPFFNPKSKLSSCHEDFRVVYDLSHLKVAHLAPADALSMKNRLSSIRSVLLRMITGWEQSGQGDGGRRNFLDSEQAIESFENGNDIPIEIVAITGGSVPFGGLEGRSQEALDNRANFLGSNPSWYLYFWEVADTFQLLDSVVQRIANAVGAADGSTPISIATTLSRKKKRRLSEDLESNNDSSLDTERISLLLERLADGGEKDLDIREKALHQEKQLAIQKRIDILKDKIDDLEVKLDDEEKEVYRRILTRKKAELKELESQLE